jgi:hypothetical protein
MAACGRATGPSAHAGERHGQRREREDKMSLHGILMTGCSIVFLAGPAIAADKPEDKAQAAAESWLKLVDDGKYAASWEQAAKVFKGAVTQDDWGKLVGGVRAPLGKLVSRKLKSREFKEKLPGAPDGKYFVIQYDTVFENKASAVETVTPMADPDGAWRVSGYFIR